MQFSNRNDKFKTVYEHVYGFCEAAQKICDETPSIGEGEHLVDLLHRSIGIFVCQLYADGLFISLEKRIQILPIYGAYLKIKEFELNQGVPLADAEYPLVWLERLFYSIMNYDSMCW